MRVHYRADKPAIVQSRSGRKGKARTVGAMYDYVDAVDVHAASLGPQLSLGNRVSPPPCLILGLGSNIGWIGHNPDSQSL